MIIDASPGTPYWRAYKRMTNESWNRVASYGIALDEVREQIAKANGCSVVEFETEYEPEDCFEPALITIKVKLKFKSAAAVTMFMLKWGGK
jgi:hypothetical protein